ncbi:MAG: hypothetical protein QXL15_00195 [Candidatus Korarchaeota archaeon]
MSIKVRELLKALNLLDLTTHEDRVEIDHEIERQTGMPCDEAIENGIITEEEFREIVMKILKQKKRRIFVELG